MLFGGKKPPSLTTGALAPEFKLSDLNGGELALREALACGPVLAAFFKVSCPTCQFAFPIIERLHKQFNSGKIAIWGISQDRTEDSQSFAEKFSVTFPVLIDERPFPVSQSYHLKYTPTLFLISPDGRIELLSEGFSKSDFISLERKLAAALGQKSEPLFQPSERIPEYKPG